MDVSVRAARPVTRVTGGKALTKGLPAAAGVLAGAAISLTGLAFDAQWHSDVGPDTFFTLPHLVLYSGTAISGLISLFVVLATTFAARGGQIADPAVGGRPVGVLGRRFTAPLGYLTTGLGAAAFLLYGLWDLWWHSLYGFDAVLESPPHIGLLLSISVSMMGALMVCAAAGRRRWAVIGQFVGGALLVAFNAVITLGLAPLNGLVNAVSVGVAFLASLVLLTVASSTGRAGAVLSTSVVMTVLQLALWFFAPWAARVYAGSIGLPMRDNLYGAPTLPGLMPMGIVVTGLAVEGLLLLARRHAWPASRAAAGAGGLGAVLVVLLIPVQEAVTGGAATPGAAQLAVTGAVAAVVGGLGGALGHRLGLLLANISRGSEVTR
ncbi:hypothetical protein [Streptosporangium carneum]|uniref:Uncharacterized protein n=1 Tax=Streptosporangium carneum TaxID=47481 RepID=A0A9W6I6F9_9ACTN|nr:hypothetical protein [Streptosporangium carneum]GLK12558.1 hypothetical protein GCM10017600_59680 [Streptosporangium carneum]